MHSALSASDELHLTLDQSEFPNASQGAPTTRTDLGAPKAKIGKGKFVESRLSKTAKDRAAGVARSRHNNSVITLVARDLQAPWNETKKAGLPGSKPRSGSRDDGLGAVSVTMVSRQYEGGVAVVILYVQARGDQGLYAV